MYNNIYIYTITGWWFQPIWKNISQLGLLFPIDGKMQAMFQTTNQIIIIITIKY